MSLPYSFETPVFIYHSEVKSTDSIACCFTGNDGLIIPGSYETLSTPVQCTLNGYEVEKVDTKCAIKLTVQGPHGQVNDIKVPVYFVKGLYETFIGHYDLYEFTAWDTEFNFQGQIPECRVQTKSGTIVCRMNGMLEESELYLLPLAAK